MVASILAGYDINWPGLIAEQIRELALKRTTCMPFLVLIYRLCMEAKVEVSLHIDPMIMALHTVNPSLIMAVEYPVAL